MNRGIYVLILVLLVFWFIGAFIVTVGKIIHTLLIVVLILAVIKMMKRRPG